MAKLEFSHIALSCKDPIRMEKWYGRHFGFRRARVYLPGPGQVVMLKRDDVYLEIFPASGDRAVVPGDGAGPTCQGVYRHIAFLVDDLDAKLTEMGADAKLTLGPIDMSQLIPNMRVAWLADPEGNIVELNQGYVDEIEPNPVATVN